MGKTPQSIEPRTSIDNTLNDVTFSGSPRATETSALFFFDLWFHYGWFERSEGFSLSFFFLMVQRRDRSKGRLLGGRYWILFDHPRYQ